MSLLFGGKTEQRATSFQDVWGTGTDPSTVLNSLWPSTNRELRSAAVWACVRLLTDQVASTPLHGYRDTTDGTALKLDNPPMLLVNPSEEMPLADWVSQAMMSLLLRGNAYGKITRFSRAGWPEQASWLDPDQVEVVVKGDTIASYRVAGKDLGPASIIHLRGITLPGKLVGFSPVAAHKAAIDVGLEAEKFGLGWFVDGAHPSAILKTDKDVTQAQADTIKSRFLTAIRGRREPAVLGNSFEYQQIQVSANESQFLESQKFSIAEVCRIFGVPPEMIGSESGGSLTYANVEQRSIDFARLSLRPWYTRLESGLSRHLPNKQWAQFNADALHRTDLINRYRAHEIGIKNSFLTVNEARELEDLEPLDEDDIPPPAGDALKDAVKGVVTESLEDTNVTEA